MPLSVKAPPPLARPWATLPRARKDEAAAHTVGVGEARPAYSSRAYRTNRSCFLDAHDEGVVRAIRAAVRAAFPEVEGRELELQVVHYKPGEVFRLHSDVGVRRNDGTFGRSWSMFVYLRGPAGGGGGTVFPRLASSDVYDGATGAVHLDCCESVDGGGVSLKPGTAPRWSGATSACGRSDVVGGAADRWLEARGSLPGWRRDAVAAALRGAAADLGLAIRIDVAWRTL
ncbi:hypothetical protein JL721_6365 [Aureococcus anophagefferens]|nr:hypothetical protein JL721_6365 [Aureococcus anophagefferens]